MAIVTEISWDDMLDGKPLPENPSRQAWRVAVAEIAAKAKDKLPECNGRIERAVALVLAGDVELLPDGTAKVANQSNGTTAYHIANGHCDCKDFAQAPHNFCKHRLSAAIARRAHELATQRLAQLDGQSNGHGPAPTDYQPVQPRPETPASAPALALSLPEAPASVNCHILLEGRQVQVTLRDTNETRLLVRLAAVLRQYPTAQPPTQPSAYSMTQPVPVCQWHGAMKESTKAKGTWYCPAKMADGSYCQSRHPEKGK
jgi:hypothetical protein